MLAHGPGVAIDWLVRMRRGLHGCAMATSIAIVGPACVREAEDFICPDVGEGDLVVTEIRGPQPTDNSLPQWIEIANVSGRDLDLEGLHFVLQRPNGAGRRDLIIRYKRSVAAGDRYVVGLLEDTQRYGGVDYGFGVLDPDPDVEADTGMESDKDNDDYILDNLYTDALLTVVACGETIDQVTWDSLPPEGTRSLRLDPPTAEDNDPAEAWCTDARDVGDGTALGIPGTPGEVNQCS